MRRLSIFLGVIRAYLQSVFSFGGFKFVFPIKLCSGARIQMRKAGKVLFGKHVSINYNAHIAVTENATLEIGDYSGIGDNNVIVAREKIVIGSNVMIGPNVCIYDHDHNFNKDEIMRDLGFSTAPIIIEDNVWIGAGAIILKGVRIKTGAVIAAGTIVREDVPENVICYDKRVRHIKQRY